MIRRLGGTEYIKVDVRVIAATNRDMRAMVIDHEFRQDLYYRLSAFPITVPPLRERKDDIAALAEYFLAKIPEGDRQLPLSPEVIETLMDYDYPGNIRAMSSNAPRYSPITMCCVLSIYCLTKPTRAILVCRQASMKGMRNWLPGGGDLMTRWCYRY